MKPKKYSFIMLIFFLLLCYGGAALGGWLTTLSVGDWYAGLRKPSWNPPNWVFAPVWMFLYGTMAVAVWLVWRAEKWEKIWLAVFLFAAQLAFNIAWSGLFFGLQNPFVAFIDILALWGFILATMISFFRLSKIAGLLFFLYFVWVSFAISLNGAIMVLNP
jgi:translocator protein